MPEPPIWYKQDEIRLWLARVQYGRWLHGLTSREVDEFSAFMAEHLQKAFEKGYAMGLVVLKEGKHDA